MSVKIKIIAKNKRASYEYQFLNLFEAGMALQGTEVKVLREGKCSMAESYVIIDKNDEVWLYNMTIPHYSHGNLNNHEEARKRKLLLHKDEIEKMAHQVKAQGLTIIPTKIYFKYGKIKLEIALAKGKNIHDKRQSQKEKDVKRKLQRGDYT